MKPFTPVKDNSTSTPLYIQLYRHIKDEILSAGGGTGGPGSKGDLSRAKNTAGGKESPGSKRNLGGAGSMPGSGPAAGEKLPSLRAMAAQTGLSLTTVQEAYDQLLTEGYISSRPGAGYYVAAIPGVSAGGAGPRPARVFDLAAYSLGRSRYIYDLSAFDFGKWKKCVSRVLGDYPELLLSESDPQGEEALRYEICRYLYSSRGVSAEPAQVVIGAGTQQLTAHLSRILKRMGITLIATEEPGYRPIRQIFSDNGFSISLIPVGEDGIEIDRLPVNVSTAVYVSPANQFPTGSVMPIANRYRLLAWARDNASYILEDDYDSELRYFGRPVPALQGLDENSRVVYLGSFSSTLFPAIKISYMILPEQLAGIFSEIKADYTQTCSKTEQLTLALFMEDGYYYTNIRKLRASYAQKLQTALNAFDRYGRAFIEPTNTRSGINIVLKVKSILSAEELAARAGRLSLHVVPSPYSRGRITRYLIFYYNQIPLEKLDDMIRRLVDIWAE